MSAVVLAIVRWKQMKQFLRTIRDLAQRAIFDTEYVVLRVLKEQDRWMTYVEVSFFAGQRKVSTDNALAALDALSIEREPDEWLVDRAYKRDGVVGMFWRINTAGKQYLDGKHKGGSDAV